MNKFIRLSIFFLLLSILNTAKAQVGTVNAEDLNWTEVAPGVWKAVVGNPDEYDLLKAAGSEPFLDALTELGSAEFPLQKSDIVGRVQNGKTALRFPLKRNEEIYGLGLHFKTVHQRGRIMRLHVDHYGGEDDGRTHAPVPFYVSSEGYGVFVNAARYIDVYVGTAARIDSENAPEARDRNLDDDWTSRPYSDAVEMLIPTDGVEFYVFAGPTPLDAVRRYNLFNGGGPLPPRWGLGFTQRVPTLFTAEKVMEEAKAFEERNFPLSFIGLEPGWQSKAYPNTFIWDEGRFPEPKEFIEELDEMGIKVNLWANPYVSPEAAFYDEILPFIASHSVWAGAVVDLTIPEAKDIYWSEFEDNLVDIGVSGFKFDEMDGYDRWLWPDVTTFPSGKSAEQMRQTYGLLMQRQSAKLFHDQNKRTYGLVRASNGGSSYLPYVLYNDYYNHEDFITALINSSFIGVLWTPEARASDTGEEWLRRIQSVMFSPMAMVNAWSSGTKPWSFPEVAEEVKEMAVLRMQMMPYWYTEFAKYHFKGTPPFRAMNLEEGFNTKQTALTLSDSEVDLQENPYAEAVREEVRDQYMAGEYLLVAPMFEGETSREVILPQGKWYDFYTGEFVGDGELITVTPGLEKIPVFVKNGGIIPMMNPMMRAPKAGEKVDLEIRHYGEMPSEYKLYDDDGETFDYENGEYSWRTIEVERRRNGDFKGSISKAERGKPNNIGKVTWNFMTK